jgi:hypothetical protein
MTIILVVDGNVADILQFNNHHENSLNPLTVSLFKLLKVIGVC